MIVPMDAGKLIHARLGGFHDLKWELEQRQGYWIDGWWDTFRP